RRIKAHRSEHRFAERTPGGMFQPRGELADPARPHEIEINQRAVLVKGDERGLDAGKRVGQFFLPRPLVLNFKSSLTALLPYTGTTHCCALRNALPGVMPASVNSRRTRRRSSWVRTTIRSS